MASKGDESNSLFEGNPMRQNSAEPKHSRLWASAVFSNSSVVQGAGRMSKITIYPMTNVSPAATDMSTISALPRVSAPAPSQRRRHRGLSEMASAVGASEYMSEMTSSRTAVAEEIMPTATPNWPANPKLANTAWNNIHMETRPQLSLMYPRRTSSEKCSEMVIRPIAMGARAQVIGLLVEQKLQPL